MKLSSHVEKSVRGIVRAARFSAAPGNKPVILRARPTNGTHSKHCPKTPVWLTVSLLSQDTSVAFRLSRLRSSRAYSTEVKAKKSLPLEPTSPVDDQPVKPVSLSKDELLSFVETRDIGSVKDHLSFYNDPFRRHYAAPDGPKVAVSIETREVNFPTREELAEEPNEVALKLSLMLSLRRRSPRRVSLTTLYDMYRRLPQPRMLHITGKMRHALLRALGTPAEKTARGMLRYFSVVADVKNCGIALTLMEWNYALALAGRYAGWSSSSELDSAVRLWKEMETEAKVQGNDVTFNILFDVASKAGNFTLSEMILREMEARKITSDRYYQVSLINFFGLRNNADGVRAAYKEMVESGEMIDTVALNCVINGLLRCGQESSAEIVYERMLHPPTSALRPPIRDYSSAKIILHVLKIFGRTSRMQPELREHLQRQVSIRPDHRTYRILVDFYAVKVGNFNRIVKLLADMKWGAVALDGRIYLALFQGFYHHGTRMRGAWSEQRLQAVYVTFMSALDAGDRNVRLTKWLALWVLRAFAKCSSQLTVFDVFVRLKQVGCLDEQSLDFLNKATTDMMVSLEWR